jgi:uncharacterized membrane protein YgcG
MAISAPSTLVQDHLQVFDVTSPTNFNAFVKEVDIVRTLSRQDGTAKVVPLGLGRRGHLAAQTLVAVKQSAMEVSSPSGSGGTSGSGSTGSGGTSSGTGGTTTPTT